MTLALDTSVDSPFFDGPDALGRRVVLREQPRRVVSLVPSLTEALVGLGAPVVGVTRFCVHPDGVRRRAAVVGGTKTVDVVRVATLAPDLVVANREENVREQVEGIEALGAPVYVTDVATVDGALATLRTLGALTGTGAAADALAARIAAGFDGLAAAPPVRAAYVIWKDPWMVAGGDTFVGDVLRRAGFVNVFEDARRYPDVTPEAVAEARPDALLFASETFRFREKHVGALRAACPSAAVAFVDGEAFSWYGPRLLATPDHVRAVRAALD